MIQLADNAVTKLREIIMEEGDPNLNLRVFVQGGGCSGMQYGFTFDEIQNEDDFNFEFDGIKVLVDSVSIQYLQDAEIRYEESDMGNSFVIKNPNAQTTCGCGSSFSPY
jgi:iron-sulfur cluster insertion protein